MLHILTPKGYGGYGLHYPAKLIRYFNCDKDQHVNIMCHTKMRDGEVFLSFFLTPLSEEKNKKKITQIKPYPRGAESVVLQQKRVGKIWSLN
jgi:hypothetical protein